MASSQYGFDNVGNITSRTTEAGNQAYTYDPVYQLTQATHPVLPPEGFTFDNVGNRQTSTNGSQSLSYTHNNNNELTQSCILNPASCITNQFDPNGNTTQVTSSSINAQYTYGSTNRLTAASTQNSELGTSNSAVYTYDPFGRRVSKTVNSITTYYVYADEGLIGEYSASGTQQKGYGWKPRGTWGTSPVFMNASGQYYYYLNDHLGTPQKMTDGIGSVVWSASYTAFGDAVVDASSTITNNLRFPGQYFDAETGLHYNWNRYYDPKTGRYTQVDPVGFGAGDINLYRYVRNNPVVLLDPSGKAAFWYHFIDGFRVGYAMGDGLWGGLKMGYQLGNAAMDTDFKANQHNPLYHATTNDPFGSPADAINRSLKVANEQWALGTTEGMGNAIHIWRDVPSHAGSYFPDPDPSLWDYIKHIVIYDLYPWGDFDKDICPK